MLKPLEINAETYTMKAGDKGAGNADAALTEGANVGGSRDG